ncbi:MAG: HTH domain-containing protein [Demequina sp.]|nr:HTH domain-containing protein [Demequina sp.]
MSENSRARVARLLGIVAYLEDNGSTSFEELAEHFGVSRDQIAKDIDQLWLVGRPGGFANDLIDFDSDSFDSGIAKITNTQGATQVRLGPREGVALVAALSAIVGAGVAPRAAQSALEKITAALGEETVTVVGEPRRRGRHRADARHRDSPGCRRSPRLRRRGRSPHPA